MSTCKGCGAEIVWATNPATGKKVPLDAKSTRFIYRHVSEKEECLQEDDDELFVSHFLTCKRADRFSGGGK